MLSRFFVEWFGRCAQSLVAAGEVVRPSRIAPFMASSADGVGVFVISKSDDDGATRSSAFTLAGPVPSPAKATMRPTRAAFPPGGRVCFRPVIVTRL